MRKYVLLSAVVLLAPAVAPAAEGAWSPTPRSDSDVNLLGLPLDQVTAGFGYGNYTGEMAEDVGAGSAWNVGADLDVSRPLDLELNYTGGINSFNGDIEPFNVYTNGVNAAVQVEPWTWDDTFTPYVSGGLGLQRLSVAKDTDLNQDFQSDTAGSVPIAAGLDVQISDNLVAGARAQYDVLFDNELIVQEGSTDANRTLFMVNLGATNF